MVILNLVSGTQADYVKIIIEVMDAILWTL